MKDNIRVALAIAAGYYLGRRHKMRLAATLMAAGVAGRMRRGGGGLLEEALTRLGASAEMEEAFERLRGDLTKAGKAAAVAATSRQIDALSSKIHDRAEALRVPSMSGAESGEGEEEEPYEEEEPVAKTRREPRLAGKDRG
jgi:hypothetical protein